MRISEENCIFDTNWKAQPMFDKTVMLTLVKALGKLVVAGVFIGLLKSYDWLIALALLAKVLYELNKHIFSATNKNWVLLIGMLLTGIGGIIGEYWGVSNGYWEYHEVSRELPLWLPFAWMLAFNFLYRLEEKLITALNRKSLRNKIVLAIGLTLIFPAVGEMITIALGVWTYYWPFQILGVPLYAFVCLVFVHMLVYAIINQICKRYKITDSVFVAH